MLLSATSKDPTRVRDPYYFRHKHPPTFSSRNRPTELKRFTYVWTLKAINDKGPLAVCIIASLGDSGHMRIQSQGVVSRRTDTSITWPHDDGGHTQRNHSRKAAEPTNKQISRRNDWIQHPSFVKICMWLWTISSVQFTSTRTAMLIYNLAEEQENAAPREIYLLSHLGDALWWLCVPQRRYCFDCA